MLPLIEFPFGRQYGGTFSQEPSLESGHLLQTSILKQNMHSIDIMQCLLS